MKALFLVPIIVAIAILAAACAKSPETGANPDVPAPPPDSQATTVPGGTPPTATPYATMTPVATPASVCDPSIRKDEVVLVPAGCTISGDVLTGPTQSALVFRGSGIADIGTIVTVTTPTWVKAPFMASVTGANPDSVAQTMLQVGCGFPTGCRIVRIVDQTGHIIRTVTK